MISRYWAVTALIVLVCAGGADAKQTKKVSIKLTGACVGVPPTIFVVMAGNETDLFPVTQKDLSKPVWTGELPDKMGTIWAEGILASARLDVGRTDCQPSHAVRDPVIPNGDIAEYVFNCDENAVKKVKIETQPGIVFRYERKLRVPGNDRSHDCDEKADGVPGSRTVRDVRTDGEDLFLYLPQQQRIGLLVNRLDVFRGQKPLDTLDFERIVDEYIAQGLLPVPPSSAPRLKVRENVKNNLKELERHNVTLTVK